MSRTVTLKQDCVVETYHHAQKLDYARCAAGEQIELLSKNGYRTHVVTMAEVEDSLRAGNELGTYTEAEVREADGRLVRAIEEGREAVYGPAY
jgi:NADH dehydrogenase FAD-containing subunit